MIRVQACGGLTPWCRRVDSSSVVRLSNIMWSVEKSSRRLRTARMLVHEAEKQDNLLLSYTYMIKEKKKSMIF